MVENLVTSSSVARDNLISGTFPLITRKIIVLSGQNIARGTLMGKIKKNTTVVVTPGANTGNGTCTLPTIGKGAKIGNYIVECKEAVIDGGVFSVVDPDGVALKDAAMGTYISNHVNFTLTDGTADFIVGDKFTLAVTAGSEKYVESLAVAVDGSQEPDSILVRAVDSSLGDKKSEAYETGQFNKEKVVFGAGHSYASTKDGLREKGIYLEEVGKE